MKNLFFIFILFMFVSCSTNKGVYWCGDHPCINKKEKEAYFRKTMIIEIKDLENKNYKSDSEYEKIKRQVKLDEKKRIKDEKDFTKQAKLKDKKRIKEEKYLLKQAKLGEKKRIKEEKYLAKQIKLEEKKRIKENKKSSQKKIVKNQKKHSEQNIELDTNIVNTEIKLSKFDELVEKINKKNTFRPYPDINDIPN